jgi:hypothetical protein
MLLSILNDNVPFFDVTVKEFAIGFVALVLAVWFIFFVIGKLKTL